MLEPSINAEQMVELINHLVGISSNNRNAYPSKKREHWFQECTVVHKRTNNKVIVPGHYYMDSAFVRDMLHDGKFYEIEGLRHDRKHFTQSGVGIATTLEEVIKYVSFFHIRFGFLKYFDYIVRIEKSADIELFMRTPHRGDWGKEHGSKIRRNQIGLGNHRGLSDKVSYWRPESKFPNEKIRTRYGGLSNAIKISPSYIGKSFYEEAQLFIEQNESFLFFEILGVQGGAKGTLTVHEEFSFEK